MRDGEAREEGRGRMTYDVDVLIALTDDADDATTNDEHDDDEHDDDNDDDDDDLRFRFDFGIDSISPRQSTASTETQIPWLMNSARS
jgi:hypothetical protein